MKPINTSKIDKYSLSYDDYSNVFYLLKSKGEVKITPQRALQWLDAGISVFDRSSKAMRETILKELGDKK